MPRDAVAALTFIFLNSIYDVDEYIHQAIKAGALGYLLKDVSKNELISAIRIVKAGNRYIPPAVFHRMSYILSALALSSH